MSDIQAAGESARRHLKKEYQMNAHEDRIDTLLNAAALLIDTAINQIDTPGQIGVNNSTLEIQDACSTLRVARGLVEQARFFPEDAKVWIPNEAAPPADDRAGGNLSFTAGPGNAGGMLSVPESPRRRDLRESYRTHGMGEFPGRPTVHGGHGGYCQTCDGGCFLDLMRLGEKL